MELKSLSKNLFLKLSSLRINKPSIVVFFPLIPKNNETVYEIISQLNVPSFRFPKIFIPLVRKNVKGIVINTYEFVNKLHSKDYSILKRYRLIKTFPQIKTAQDFKKGLIVDLFPIYNQLAPLFEKYEDNELKYFELYFSIVSDYLVKLEKYKLLGIDIYPILVSNVYSDEDIKYFEKMENYIRKRSYKIPISNYNVDLYGAVPFIKNPIYLILALSHKEDSGAFYEWEFLKRNLEKFFELTISRIKSFEKLVNKTIDDSEIEKISKHISVVATNSVIGAVLQNIDDEERKQKIENLAKQIVSEYVKEKNISIDESKFSSEEDYNQFVKQLFSNALKEKLNLVYTDVSQLSPEQIVDILEFHSINPVEIKAAPVDKIFNKLFNLEENIKVNSTTIDLHEKEFEKRIDGYIKTLFRMLEDTKNLPVQKSIVNVQRKLIDDNVDRYWLYTFTLKNEKTGETYDVNIKIPALINKRYFKIGGKTYILTNQRFLKPLTVTEKNKARFLTYYAIVTLDLRNYKLSINDPNTLIEYIKQKYPKLIVEDSPAEVLEQIEEFLEPIKYEYVKFRDGDILFGYNPISPEKFVIVEKSDGARFIYDKQKKEIIYIDKEGNETETGLTLSEFLTEYLIEKIKKENPNDRLSDSKINLPYLEIYLGGLKMPYILFLFGNLGVKKSLEKLGIEFSIDDKKDKDAYISIPFNNGEKFVNIYPRTNREKFIVNGLFTVKYEDVFSKFDLNEFESKREIRDEFLDELFGSGAAHMNELFRKFMVDPITKDVLKAEGFSTNYFDILTKDLPDILFNSKVFKPTDIRIHRARLSEIVLHILYKQLAQAKHEFEKRIKGLIKAGKQIKEEYKDKYYIDPDYILKQLVQGESLLQYTEPVNPVDELNVATRITPKGIGGLPNDAVTIKHRLISFHKDPNTGKYVSAHFRNISPLDTNEYSNVGSNAQLTWGAIVSDKYGLFHTKYDLSDVTFETLGIGESLAPFVNSVDHDRVIKMAQQLRQTIPINNPTVPYIMTGTELLIPQVASPRFVIKSEGMGKVVDIVPDKYIKVAYEDGTTKIYNIMPRLARIKRGLFMPVKLIPQVKKGDIVKTNQILATSVQLTNGVYKYGRNVCTAINTYRAAGYEDAWVVTESALKKFAHKRYQEVIVIVPPDASVDIFKYQKGTKVKFGDVILRFKYDKSLKEYMDETGLGNVEELEAQAQLQAYSGSRTIFENNGYIEIKSPVDGEIKEVRIYINGRKKLDPVIEKAWETTTKEYKQMIEMAKLYNGEEDYSFEDTIDTTMFVRSGHKYKGNEFKGALVVFLIETERIPQSGDKFVFRGGNKGTVTAKVIPEGKEPIALDTKLKIEWIHNPLSIVGRKNANFLIEIGLGKIFYFLNKKVREMLNDKKIKTEEIKKFIVDVYKSVAQIFNSEKINNLVNSLEQNIQIISDKEFREWLKDIDEENNPKFVFIAPAFAKIEYLEKIEEILKEYFNVPLYEKVYFPELKTYSEKSYLVGFAYVTILEHMPDIMAGFRSTGKYSAITGQGQKGESRKGEKGSLSLDSLTVGAIISALGVNSKVLKEFFTVQSDDHLAKKYVINKILQEGKSPEEYPTSETKSKRTLRNLFYSLHLDPGF